MRFRRYVRAASLLVIGAVLVACGQDAQGPGSQPGEGQGTGVTTVAEAHNDVDTEFVQMMIVHHEGAIEMAEDVARRTSSEEIRQLAQEISAAQGPEIVQMTSWLRTWGEPVAPEGHGGMEHGGMQMEGMGQEEAMAELQTLSVQDLDRRFLELMIAHHEGAVAMAQAQLEGGENPEALALAEKVIVDQQEEIELMREMLAGG
jgi:uncharacterized protein (DUF305 family)